MKHLPAEHPGLQQTNELKGAPVGIKSSTSRVKPPTSQEMIQEYLAPLVKAPPPPPEPASTSASASAASSSPSLALDGGIVPDEATIETLFTDPETRQHFRECVENPLMRDAFLSVFSCLRAAMPPELIAPHIERLQSIEGVLRASSSPASVSALASACSSSITAGATGEASIAEASASQQSELKSASGASNTGATRRRLAPGSDLMVRRVAPPASTTVPSTNLIELSSSESSEEGEIKEPLSIPLEQDTRFRGCSSQMQTSVPLVPEDLVAPLLGAIREGRLNDGAFHLRLFSAHPTPLIPLECCDVDERLPNANASYQFSNSQPSYSHSIASPTSTSASSACAPLLADGHTTIPKQSEPPGAHPSRRTTQKRKAKKKRGRFPFRTNTTPPPARSIFNTYLPPGPQNASASASSSSSQPPPAFRPSLLGSPPRLSASALFGAGPSSSVPRRPPLLSNPMFGAPVGATGNGGFALAGNTLPSNPFASGPSRAARPGFPSGSPVIKAGESSKLLATSTAASALLQPASGPGAPGPVSASASSSSASSSASAMGSPTSRAGAEHRDKDPLVVPLDPAVQSLELPPQVSPAFLVRQLVSRFPFF